VTIQKSPRKHKNKFIKRAALVLALAAGALFFSHRCGNKEDIQKTTDKPKIEQTERTQKRTNFRLLARRHSERMDLLRIIKNDRQISDDLDYDSFNCPLIIKQPKPKEQFMNYLITNTIHDPSSTPGSLYGFLRYHAPSGFQNPEDDLKLNYLGDKVAKLKADKDVERMVQLLHKFDKQNLVWEGEYNLESLADVYLNMYSDAKLGSPAPDFRCVMKNLKAVALFYKAISALEGMVCKDHNMFQSSFPFISNTLRRQVSLRCFIALKMRTLGKEMQKRLDELGNPDNLNVARIFRTNRAYLSLVQGVVQESVNGYKDLGFRRFYSGEKMESDSLLGMHDDMQNYELMVQSAIGPIKYGVAGIIHNPAYYPEESESDFE
jgi:hypothetical protein